MKRPIVPNIPTPVPSRNDPVHFSERADATLGAIPATVEGMNKLGEYVEQRAAQVDEALLGARKSETAAGDSAGASEVSRVAAEKAARGAASAPASPSTSASALTIVKGSQSFVTQPGRLWAPGQYVRLALTADPLKVGMDGVVIDYDAVTGQMRVAIGEGMTQGAGTFSGWTITSSGPPSSLAQLGLPGPAGKPSAILAVNDKGTAYELRALATLFAPIRHLFGVPVGMIAYRAGSTTPAGWLRLNGAVLSRTAYPDLWAFAQDGGLVTEAQWRAGYFGRFSTGDGATNFRLPDARAMTLRALDDARGMDAGREWGKFQETQNLLHGHSVWDGGHAHPVADGGHTHGAWTDAQGHHDHANGIARAEGQFGLAAAYPYGGAYVNAIAQIAMDGRYRVEAAGAHGHNVGIGVSGTGVWVQAAVAGIGIYADGGNEARVNNLAYPLFIKY